MVQQLDDRRTQRRLERLDAARDLLLHYEPLLLELWGPGELIGREWFSQTPKLGVGQRLTVNLSYGTWVLDDRTGDTLVALVQELLPAPHERAALDWAARWLQQHNFKSRSKARRAAVTYMPAPPDKLLDWAGVSADPQRFWTQAGMPPAHVYQAHWEYRDPAGQLLFYVVRFAHVQDPTKLYRKFAYFGVTVGWRLESVVYQVPPPWPLYNLPELQARPRDPVLLVEGEKTAEAARLLLPGYVVSCWPGGVGSTRYVDWSALAERHVTLWPDNDDPGRKAMLAVHGLLISSNTADLALVQPHKLAVPLPLGWDLADELPAGLDPFTTVVAAHDVPEWVVELNTDHFISTEGGHARVFWEQRDSTTGNLVLHRMQAYDFCLFEDNRRVNDFDARGNPIFVGRGSAWLQHKHRRQYTTTVFAPEREVEAHEYNLWRGYGCGSRAGLPRRTLRFIRDVICAGRKTEFLYVLRWLARLAQLPHKPADVALVLCGAKGIGKGFFANLVGSLMPQHFTPLSNPEHLTGRFNGHLRKCVVLFLDEAFYAGDKKHASILSALITEPLLSYESKGVDPIPDWNRMHLIIASNNEWVIPASLDERRFCVLTVSPQHQRDTLYFRGLQEALDAGEREQLLNLLLGVDLRDWTPLAVPQNLELSEQKTQNVEPHVAFLLDRLATGEWVTEQPTKDLHAAYVNYCERVGVARRKSVIALARSLGNVLGSAYSSKKKSLRGQKLMVVTLHERDVRRALVRQGVVVPADGETEPELPVGPDEELPY